MPNSCKAIRESPLNPIPGTPDVSASAPGAEISARALLRSARPPWKEAPLYPRSVAKPCDIVGNALAQCLQESDCIMVQRHTPRECLSTPLVDELPTRCQQLRKGLSECKYAHTNFSLCGLRALNGL